MTGPLHPVTDAGVTLDATLEVESATDGLALVFHHRARGRDDPGAVNRDYDDGLELVLRRLARASARIERIEVDSSVAKRRPPSERVLALAFPILLRPSIDAAGLRLEIGRAQRDVARRPSAKPGGGNNQKRIRMWLGGERLPRDPARLADLLVRGG